MFRGPCGQAASQLLSANRGGRQMPTTIDISHVSKAFVKAGQPLRVLDDVSISVEEGEFVALIGPSGCGKSTILNMVAGLIAPDVGHLRYEGLTIDAVNTAVGYMTQSDSLLPWRTVEGNISAALDIQRIETHEKQRRVREAIETVDLVGFEKHRPHELSGGMRKRVLLARTLIYNPATLLMDEPFGALDALLRIVMQEELLRIWNNDRRTVVYVTHDLSEAITLADRVIVFSKRPGRVVLDQRIDLPRPRVIDSLRTSAEFLDIYDQLWSTIRLEVASPTDT